MEILLYGMCRQYGITYVTICHRPALQAYHDYNLHLLGEEGKWEMRKLHHEEGSWKYSAPVLAPSKAEGHVGDSASEATRVRSLPYAGVARPALPTRSALQRLRILLKVLLPGSAAPLFALVCAIGLRTASYELFSKLSGMLYKAVLKKDKRTFAILVVVNAFHALFSGALEEAVTFMQNRLTVRWQESLYGQLAEKLMRGKMGYYLQHVDGRIEGW
tara:strand:- start:229 stop:879 length:651 start_codon:yes stop_codon:yes gene_type:complete